MGNPLQLHNAVYRITYIKYRIVYRLFIKESLLIKRDSWTKSSSHFHWNYLTERFVDKFSPYIGMLLWNIGTDEGCIVIE